MDGQTDRRKSEVTHCFTAKYLRLVLDPFHSSIGLRPQLRPSHSKHLSAAASCRAAGSQLPYLGFSAINLFYWDIVCNDAYGMVMT